MAGGCHRSSCTFAVLQLEALEHVLSVLGLVDEGAFLCLLDLKAKEVLQLTHHRHLKHVRHQLSKLLIKIFVSRTKDNVINIELTYEQLPINSLGEESRVDLPNLESTVYQQLSKVLIPRTWGLFKAIERLVEAIDMVRKVRVLKPGRLSHIHQLTKRAIQESTLDIHLLQLEIMVVGIGQKDTDGLKSSHWSKGLSIVNVLHLRESLCNQTCLVADDVAVSVWIVLEHPLGADNIAALLRLLY